MMLRFERRIFSSVLCLLIFIVPFCVVVAAGTNHNGRQLDETDNTPFPYNDLSTYSIRYQKCQSIKMFDDELAASQQSQTFSSPLATRHFVVFRMCPSNVCTLGCASETKPYGTYALPVEDYLSYTVNYQKQELEQSCAFCNAYCLQDDGQSYCTSGCSNSLCTNCASLCDDYNRYNTAIANGNAMIADAADFIQCQQISAQNDDVDEEEPNDEQNDSSYYIGPYCQTVDAKSSKHSVATTSSQVVIGVFSDANCYDPVYDVNVTDVLYGVQLSYHFLKHTSTAASATSNPLLCLSCLEGNRNQNDANDVDDVNEMCENIYQGAAKCESPTGLSEGFIQMNREGGENNEKTANQVENEFMACTFIDSIVLNSYTETGVINLSVPQDIVGRYVTPKQRKAFLLIFAFICLCIGLMVYYHRRIKDLQSGGTAAIAIAGGKRKALLIQKGEKS
jgi:hypothetical protein